MNDFLAIPGWILISIIIVVVVLWFVIGRSQRKSDQNHPFYTEYFTGLNYLLNDEQGKALDVFVKLVENNWDIIDTHFALGKIFRKNGEIDKAIKIHQGLIARPSLPERYRSRVLLELGYDYLGAGWFDRAEGLFKEVLIHDKNSTEARRNLILIYQQEKDWDKAISIAVDLFRENPSEIGPMISQYYCELADEARLKGDIHQIEHNANQSLRYDSASVRASIMLAELETERADYKKAIHYLEQVEHQDAEFLPVVLERLIECYHKLDAPEKLLKYLDQIEVRQDSLYLMEMHAMVIERYQGKEAAIEYLSRKLKQQPSIRGMHRLLAYKTSKQEPDRENLMNDLQSALARMQKDHTEYQCHHCGYQANTLYWLCPSCQSWGEIKPGVVEAA